MKREVSRRRELPPFEIDVGQLGALWERCRGLMGDIEPIFTSVSVEVDSNETLKFDSFEELKAFNSLPDRAISFSLWISGGDRYISLRVRTYAPPEVVASGDSEAWCAGVVETVHSFVRGCKVWYNWLIGMPVGWLLYGVLFGVPAATVVVAKVRGDYMVPAAAIWAWAGGIAALGLLWYAREKLFPVGVLRVRETRGFLRRNVGELSLLVAALSAVISIIGLFASK